MLRYVNNNRLGSRVACVPCDRQKILDETQIHARPETRKFFTENKTETPNFNASMSSRMFYTPNLDNHIYYPWIKFNMHLQETYREYDWTTFENYTM